MMINFPEQYLVKPGTNAPFGRWEYMLRYL